MLQTAPQIRLTEHGARERASTCEHEDSIFAHRIQPWGLRKTTFLSPSNLRALRTFIAWAPRLTLGTSKNNLLESFERQLPGLQGRGALPGFQNVTLSQWKCVKKWLCPEALEGRGWRRPTRTRDPQESPQENPKRPPHAGLQDETLSLSSPLPPLRRGRRRAVLHPSIV